MLFALIQSDILGTIFRKLEINFRDERIFDSLRWTKERPIRLNFLFLLLAVIFKKFLLFLFVYLCIFLLRSAMKEILLNYQWEVVFLLSTVTKSSLSSSRLNLSDQTILSPNAFINKFLQLPEGHLEPYQISIMELLFIERRLLALTYFRKNVQVQMFLRFLNASVAARFYKLFKVLLPQIYFLFYLFIYFFMKLVMIYSTKI